VGQYDPAAAQTLIARAGERAAARGDGDGERGDESHARCDAA
jgi:hypothetical protein